jgi:hypothetical protein
MYPKSTNLTFNQKGALKHFITKKPARKMLVKLTGALGILFFDKIFCLLQFFIIQVPQNSFQQQDGCFWCYSYLNVSFQRSSTEMFLINKIGNRIFLEIILIKLLCVSIIKK